MVLLEEFEKAGVEVIFLEPVKNLRNRREMKERQSSVS
jgi:hypothetical protein